MTLGQGILSKGEMMPVKEYEKPKEIESFAALTIDGPAYEMDLTENAWEYGAPPPHAVYMFKWMLAKGGLSYGEGKKGDPSTFYTRIAMEGSIVDGEWKGAVCYAYLDSRVFRGKKISTMAGFLKCAYGIEQMKKLGALTPLKQGQLIEKLLKKEPELRAELEWKGSYDYLDNKGDKQYDNVRRTYDEFPDDPADKTKKQHVFDVTGVDGKSHEVRAQTRIEQFFGKGDDIDISKKKKAVVDVGNVVEPELEMEPEKGPARVATAPTKPVQMKMEDKSSEDLMLE